MRAKKYWLMALAGLAIAVVTGLALWYRGSDSDPFVGNPSARLAVGKAVYDAHCAACHGADLAGQPNWRERLANGRLPAPPHDATGHTWHHDDDMLFTLTKQGPGPFAPPGYQSDMPAYSGTLSDGEIRAVLAYIKSTWPPEIQARQSAITAQARKGR